MYQTCMFCNEPLGANEVVETFPVGRRLAFDAAKGRLWVVCRNCERWNLTPLEERWEAVEDCEKLFRGTRIRTSTENIGLAKHPEGLELVRIGEPLRPEFAAWRYGDQFGRRRRRQVIVWTSVGVAFVGGVAVSSSLLAGGFLAGLAGGFLAGLVAGAPQGAIQAWNNAKQTARFAWVPDTRNGRMSVFDPEGGFVESFPFADGNFNWIWNGAMVDGSRIYRPGRTGNRRLLRVFDLTMKQVDSLPLPSDDPEDEEFDPTSQPGAFYQELDGGYMAYSIPFYANEVRYLDRQGVFWSSRGGDPAYRFKRWQPGGDTTLLVETRRPPVGVPTIERDSVIDMMRQMVSNMGVGEWDWSRVPTVKPAVEAIFESVEGNLWIRTPAADGGVLFDVYSRDGAYLGTASLGPGLTLFDRVAPVVRGELAWLVVTDEFDVNYVVRARIAPANQSPA